MPGLSETIQLSADPSHVFSYISMIVCTNDGFTGINGMTLPAPGASVTAMGIPYDAGSESNIQDTSYFVGAPPCGGDPVNISDDEGGVIAAHPGQAGVAGQWAFAAGASLVSIEITNLEAAPAPAPAPVPPVDAAPQTPQVSGPSSINNAPEIPDGPLGFGSGNVTAGDGTAAADGTTELALTGVETTVLAALGLVMVATGGAALIVNRRREE